MSEDRDPRVVNVAPDLRSADRRAAWLGEKGFPCEVVAPEAPVEPPDGIGLTAPANPGVEIRVLDVDQAEKAREALDTAMELETVLRERRDRRAAQTTPVTAVCEECGQSSEWPALDMGSTQECPHCGRYLDVPDPDDDWGDVDFGTEDEDAPPADPKPADGP